MITRNNSVSNVSYIQNETMKQKQKCETRLGTNYETECAKHIYEGSRLQTRKNAIDIKALAQRVLEGRERKKNETDTETKLETRIKIDETSLKRINKEDILYQFEERISIMVFDGKMNETEATNQAFLEIIKNNFYIPYE